uniref:Uncharacterized protein n=1 Tax=Arundo donax TaxID=35708 RepID=A0A0A9FCM9_ARUDO
MRYIKKTMGKFKDKQLCGNYMLWKRLLAAPISVARRANQQELLQVQNRKAKGRRS